MISFRQAKLADAAGIIDVAVASVSNDPLPVRISREAMADTAKSMIGNPSQFVWVAEQGGKIVAAVAACVQPSFWFERQQCSVMLFYSTVPGAGLPLMRELIKWIKGRPSIKVAVFELEPTVDPRIKAFLRRAGFNRSSENLSYIRGAK